MDKITHEVRRAHWMTVIEQCQHRPDGMSIREWCNEQGVNEKQYYYWQRKLRHSIFNQLTENNSLPSVPSSGSVTFAEIPIKPPQDVLPNSGLGGFIPDAVFQTGNVTVALSNSASPQLIRQIMEAAVYVK